MKNYVEMYQNEDKGAEVLKAAQRAAGHAVNVIANKSGIARAEIMTYFDDAAAEAALMYYALGTNSIAAAIPEMCRAAASVINHELYGHFQLEEIAPDFQLSDRVPGPEAALVMADTENGIMELLPNRIREIATAVHELDRGGYTQAEIAALLHIGQAAVSRHLEAWRRAGERMKNIDAELDALEALIASDLAAIDNRERRAKWQAARAALNVNPGELPAPAVKWIKKNPLQVEFNSMSYREKIAFLAYNKKLAKLIFESES